MCWYQSSCSVGVFFLFFESLKRDPTGGRVDYIQPTQKCSVRCIQLSEEKKNRNVNLENSTPPTASSCCVVVIQEEAGSTEVLPGRIRHGWCDHSPLAVRVCLFHDTLNKQGRCFNESRRVGRDETLTTTCWKTWSFAWRLEVTEAAEEVL